MSDRVILRVPGGNSGFTVGIPENFSKLYCPGFPPGFCWIIPCLFFFYPLAFLEAATLHSRTIQAYEAYLEKVEEELEARRNGSLPYLMVSESPGNQISLEKDLVVLRNLHEDDDTPKGLIHDWLGATQLKGATLEETLQILTDYDQYQEIFEEILSSRLVEHSGDLFKVRMRIRKEGLMTVVADARQEIRLHRISNKRAQLFCRSTKINEVENPGTDKEKILPEGNDRGLLWRLNSYISLEETDDGVILECRSLNLTRGIPFGIGLVIGSFLKKLPPDSVESMLSSLKSHMAEKSDPTFRERSSRD